MAKRQHGLADRLREEVRRQGLTGKDLGNAAGITERNAQRFLAGTAPSVANLERIIAALGWTVGPKQRSK